MTSKVSNFGSECIIKEKYIKEILKSNIVTNIIEYGKAKAKIKLHKALTSTVKKSSRLLGIEKLEDANLAGTKDFEKCTLILTEGDSAKCLAMAGIEVVGRDYYGCFPLRGKVLNVRGAKDAQIIKNEEIQNVIKILGLKVGMDYSNELKGLRYGHLLIMTDQDYDGSHIKGLIINFIHFFWPSLIKRKDFLQEFITPIVKATKEGQKSLTFFTMKEYSDWFNNNNHNGYKIKYYKGLGTSTSKEAKEYFNEINKLRLNFKYINNEDDKSIELGFSKDETEGRKNWLLNFDPFNTYLDQSSGEIRYKNFINEELIFFSYYDNIRSIPSMMDGLKPSERKILFGCFKRNLRSEIKVAQLSGYVSEVSSYHHGEISLSQTITALAQDYVGSNNINLLLPLGQFGTRYNGIKGAASPRYIFTNLNPITRKIFMENDDNLLLYNVEEGLKIEPVWYAPIIPMVLVNGAEGIGTGWSTSVPEYNPIDLAQNLIRKIRGESMEKMVPWYKGFHGKIMESVDNKGNTTFISSGVINVDEEKEIVEISELPVKEFTRDYKTFLEKNHVDNKEYTGKKDFIIEDIKEYHIDNRISFVLKLSDESFNYIKRLSNDDLIKIFKLTSNLPTTNMVLFDSKNKIKKYNNIEEIINEFYEVRLDYYKQRKNYLLAKVGFALEKNKNKKKFINMVLEGDLPFKGTKNKKEVFKLLQSKGFTSLNELKKTYSEAFKVKSTEIVIENNNDNKEDVLDYDYLMNMNIWSLTHEKVNELEETIKNQTAEYDFLSKSKPEDLWIKDLEDFITVYKKVINNLDEKNKEAENKIKETRSKVKIKQKRKNKKTKNDIKNKNKDSFITDSVNSGYSVYSSSSSVSSEEDLSEEDGNYTIYTESSNKKTKNKNKVNKEKIISLDEEEGKSDRKKNIENRSIESNLKLERIKKSLTQSEQNILAEIGIKQIKESNDPSKLTLRERLALRVAKGNLGTIPKKEYKIPIKPNLITKEDLDKELDIKEVEELLDNDFLGKKTKPSTQKLKSGKKDGKASTKKKKVIEDSEDIEVIDDDDEEFKL